MHLRKVSFSVDSPFLLFGDMTIWSTLFLLGDGGLGLVMTTLGLASSSEDVDRGSFLSGVNERRPRRTTVLLTGTLLQQPVLTEPEIIALGSGRPDKNVDHFQKCCQQLRSV
jgi:hypothetical protein